MSSVDFAVPYPEAGTSAILTFEIDDLEKLEAKFGSDPGGYIAAVSTGLTAMRSDVIRACLAIGLKGGDLALALRAVPVATICERIADALSLRLHGKRTSDAA